MNPDADPTRPGDADATRPRESGDLRPNNAAAGRCDADPSRPIDIDAAGPRSVTAPQPRVTDPSRPIASAASLSRSAGRRWRDHWPGVVLGGIVAVCCGLPLAWVAWQILLGGSDARAFLPDWFHLAVLTRTLVLSALSAVGAVVLAMPVGLMLGRSRGFGSAVVWTVLASAAILPSIVTAYGWSQAGHLLGLKLEPGGYPDMARCVLTLSAWLMPIAAASIGLGLARADASVLEQAEIDGGRLRVTLALVASPAIAGGLVAFLLAMQEFAVFEPTGIGVVATDVRTVFETGLAASSPGQIAAVAAGSGAAVAGQSTRAASAVLAATPAMAVTLLIAAALALWAKRAGIGSATMDSVASESRQRHVPKILPWLAIALCIGVPVVSLGFSLRNPRPLVDVWTQFSPQILGTAMVAGLTGLLAAFVAGLSTLARPRGLVLAAVCFLIGGPMIAIAWLRLTNRPGLGWLYDTAGIAVLAYLSRFLWIPLVVGRMTWSGSWRAYRDMAAVDGASPSAVAWRVILPLAAPMAIAAGVVVAAMSAVEVPATALLAPQRPPMLVPLMLTWVHMQRYDPMIEASLLTAGVSLLAGIAAGGLWTLSRRRTPPAGRSTPGRPRVRSSRRAAAIRSLLPAMAWVGLFAMAGCDDPDQPLGVFGGTGTGPGQFVYPRAIDIHPGIGEMVVIDRMARVQRLGIDGTSIAMWNMPEQAMGKPVGVSYGPDGLIYVADTHYHRVMVYDPSGTLVRQWGTEGNGDGQFVYPTDIAFDSQRNVYVSEYGDNDRIQVFTPGGDYLRQFGRFGSGPGAFSRPQSMVIDGNTLYVADACNHRIGVFDIDGRWIRSIGSVGSSPGQFRFPYGLTMDSRGRLVVAEFGNNRVQWIDPQTGQARRTWGRGGRNNGELAYPWAVAVDANDRAHVLDSGNNRVQVIAP